jgi:hypothetical protein
MTGLEMFFWVVAAIVTAYGLIKWWERATARAAEAAKEAEETRKWEAGRAKQAREVHDLMALRKVAEQSELPRERIPEEIDGYHVSSMDIETYILDDNDNSVAIDPIVKVRRYYCAHDMLDDDGAVTGAFDPRRVRSEQYALRDLPDGELLAAFVHASSDISVSVSLGTFEGFQDYELEESRVAAAEIKRRGLA